MKKIFPYIVSLLLVSCSTSKYALQSGDYNLAVLEAVNSIQKNPAKHDKEKRILEQAFAEAQKEDFAKIQSLKATIPSSWPDIFEVYERIDGRQKLVAKYAPYFLRKEFRNIELKTTDISREMTDAKKNALDYLYKEGEKLLATNNKKSARRAYEYFLSVKDLSSTYPNIEQKIKEAKNKGTVIVSAGIINVTKVNLPSEVEQANRMGNIPSTSEWIQFVQKESGNDYVMLAEVQKMDVSPERIQDSKRVETKTIQDGWEYELDKKGNVKKDSLGNDIKKAKMITISANIIESYQSKQAIVSGEYIIKRVVDNKIIKSFPFNEVINFENRFIVFKGDKRALTEKTARMVGGQPLPFPSDMKMIADDLQVIKTKFSGFIKDNQAAVLE